MDDIPVSDRAARIEYAIRDVVIPATKLEQQGHEILKLNIGDPIAYPGLPTPAHMVAAFQQSLADGESGYSPSYGVPPLRDAIAVDETRKGWNCSADDVYVCHGVTEALQIIFAATLETGTKVLAPGPHYPPYMAYPQMFGAKTIEYRLASDDGWKVDFDDIEVKMDEDVRLLVLINPNNPCGNVAGSDEIDRLLEIAGKWPNCMIIADEIYDRLDFTGTQVSVASRSSDTPVFTLNGVSKNYYAPGWRIGYIAIHDPSERLSLVRDGIERLLRSRLCASTPAQMGYLAGLQGEKDWMKGYFDKVEEQRDLCLARISQIEGLEVEAPGGAFYMFVRLTDERWRDDDKAFVLQLLEQEHVLVVHGSGFSQELGKGHIRIVYLPNIEVLNLAFDRIDNFLKRHR
jgi:aspartate/methionine/tyrosine aminotransferase